MEDSLYYYRGAKPAGGGYKRGGNLIVFGLSNDRTDNPVLFAGDGYDYLAKFTVVNR